MIPLSVTEIGEAAFEGCNISELSHPLLTIKNGCAIKDNVVLYCASLSDSIAIPEGVTEIRWDAFSGCTSLSSVEFCGTMAQWKSVYKYHFWHKEVPAKNVKCADGEVAL